ncbi:MAG: hypothetical protein AAF663_11435, partial [Planctomycetota bacterium]
LVVISIIALLIGILLPALGAARKTARTTACLSNIRQMNTAVLNYAADNKQTLPSNFTAGELWYDEQRIGYYLPDGGITGSASIDGFAFACPADEGSERTYAMNGWASSDAQVNGAGGTRVTVDSPEQTQLILMAEAWTRFGDASTNFAGATVGTEAGFLPGQRFGADATTFDNGSWHGGTANVAEANTNYLLHGGNDDITQAEGRSNWAFMDGHAQSAEQTELYDAATGLSTYVFLWSSNDELVEP